MGYEHKDENFVFKKDTNAEEHRWKHHKPNTFLRLRHGWYKHLWQVIYDGVNNIDELKFNLKKLTVVTFNYDRSLEQFLFQAIRSLFRCESDVAKNILESLQIHHVYGRIGDISGETHSAYGDLMDRLCNRNLEFDVFLSSRELHQRGSNQGNPIDHADRKIFENLKNVAAQLKTYTEATEKPPAIMKRISESEQLFFLGFGYHPQNILWLDPGKPISPELYGTTYGLGESKVMSFLRFIENNTNFSHHAMINWIWNNYDASILDYLQRVKDIS